MSGASSVSALWREVIRPQTSSYRDSTAEKVKAFFASCKDKIVSAFETSKAAIVNFYKVNIHKIIDFANENKLPIAFTVAALALLFFHPLTIIVFGSIGFATNKIFPSEQNDKIVNISNFVLTAVGTLALAIPSCSLTALAIIAGSIGIGRTVNNLYSKVFHN